MPTAALIGRRPLLASAALPGSGLPRWAAPAPVLPADQAQTIVDRIKLPRIPKRGFSLTAFGGKADGGFDNTAALAEAIAACVEAGGGRIVLPIGTVLTGPIRLRSDVELHVPAGCRLSFIPEPARYLPVVHTRWEGVELMGHQPLIYAYGEHDIAVTGGGILDGSADDNIWRPWKGSWAGKFTDTPLAERQAADRAKLFDLAERRVPVAERAFGAGSRPRPPFFQPYRYANVLFDGLTVVAAPSWLPHPVECRSVTPSNVTCASHGPNNDGIDPESCIDALIDRCTFDTGDDRIAIKAGRNADGRRIAKAFVQIWLHYEEGGGFVPSANRITISDSQVGRTGRVLVVRGMVNKPVTGLVLSNVRVGPEKLPSVALDTKDIVLDRAAIAGKTWTRADVARLRGLNSISCDKWGVCR